MKAKLTRNSVYTLEMDSETAYWLKCLVQNPLGENESTRDSEIRKGIWDALPTLQWLQREVVYGFDEETPDNV